jgi:UDP-N-acetylglucosamine diphosphorylase/glucosamine-1-phosphate N-acetyltransferase
VSFDVVLFDDSIARDWMPFTLTRPAGELLFGALTFRERIEKAFGARCIGYLANPALRDFDEPGAPPVLDPANIPRDRAILYMSSRFVPDGAHDSLGDSHAVLHCGNDVCGFFRPAGAPEPDPAVFLGASRAAGAQREIPGRLVQRVWHLISQNNAQTADDIKRYAPAGGLDLRLQDGVYVLGNDRLAVHETVQCEPGVVIDLSTGPVWLDAGVQVKAFTRLAGPAYIGKSSILLGGPYAHVSIGPMCRVHGEVEESIVLGYSNKAHDGFLGHAYLGKWVNLGALTTNSDLKNNYGPVRLWTPSGETDTGETKIGVLLGDHVKTGIGTMLNTGTVVGAGSNLYGSAMPPKYVPPFSWGTGEELVEYRVDKFLEVARVVMGRRKVVLSEQQRALLESAFQSGRAMR